MQKKINKEKLYIFANAFWAEGQGLAGGDKRFIEIAKRKLTQKFEIAIIASKMAEENYRIFWKEMQKEATFLITPFSSLDKLGIIPSYFFRSFLAILNIPKFGNNYLFYSTSDFLPDVIPAIMGKYLNKNSKWVQVIHHIYPNWQTRPGNKITNFIAFYAQRMSFFFIKHFADLIIVVNSFVKDELINLGFDKTKIEINPNGIDTDYFQRVRPIKKKRFEGIFLGRLSPSKGIFDLVKIWRIVCDKYPEAKLGLIGNGEEAVIQKLKSEIKKNGLENSIKILGFLENDIAFGTEKASKIFVFPSYEEGFGIAPLEAQACGLPVVAWNLPAFEEVFPEGMIKVEIGNIEKFASKVMALMANKQLYQELAEEAINNARRYDWDKVAKRELYLLEKVKRANG